MLTQPFRACDIAIGLIGMVVDASVDLYDQLRLMAMEIDDERADRVLATELNGGPPVSQASPEDDRRPLERPA